MARNILPVGVAGLGPAVALRKILLWQTDAAGTTADYSLASHSDKGSTANVSY